MRLLIVLYIRLDMDSIWDQDKMRTQGQTKHQVHLQKGHYFQVQAYGDYLFNTVGTSL